MNLVLSPYPGVTLLSWSLVQGTPLAGPKWNGRDTYYVYYSCGSDPEPWKFSLDLLVSCPFIAKLFFLSFLHWISEIKTIKMMFWKMRVVGFSTRFYWRTLWLEDRQYLSSYWKIVQIRFKSMETISNQIRVSYQISYLSHDLEEKEE